jgi:hypothetical protein
VEADEPIAWSSGLAGIPELDVTESFGMARPEVMAWLLETVVAPSIAGEVRALLVANGGSYVYRFAYDDRSAELVGGLVVIVQPELPDANGRAILIEQQYSEVF